jgi:hypothetical protein
MVQAMTRTLIATLAALLNAAAPAAAKGGDTPPPPPQEWVDPCEGYWDLPAYSDGTTPLVNRTAGGCVVIHAYTSGLLLLDYVVLVPGWTYEVESNGGGSKNRVEIEFTNPTTGERAQIRVEPGKTDIR